MTLKINSWLFKISVLLVSQIMWRLVNIIKMPLFHLTFLNSCGMGLGERKDSLTSKKWPHLLQTQLSKRLESQKIYQEYLILKNKVRKNNLEHSVGGGKTDVLLIIVICQQKIKRKFKRGVKKNILLDWIKVKTYARKERILAYIAVYSNLNRSIKSVLPRGAFYSLGNQDL